MATNILDNQNYINRDFQTVYSELVDTVGKLNNKWLIDGEGNESDPGVIIVKELAACVDKLSYIADKYQLENYPSTVQLDNDARRLFAPTYKMKWYQSAEGTVVIRNIGENTIVIPQRLMICSEDKANIYTIVTTGNTEIAAGTTVAFPIIEGKLKTLTVNGSDHITIDNLIDNKIYIDDYSVAENGIWVQAYNSANQDIDVDTISSTRWVQVDNLYAQDWSTNSDSPDNGQYYEFKIDTITGRPYLQFVDDIVNKIGDGLKIQYVISSGIDGSVSAGKLTEVYAADSELTIDSDNLQIVNVLPIANGRNPETIEEGRIGYLKNVDICNTLVTLRDYANYIYNNGNLVSNCFVCDQNNDVQYAYSILTKDGQVKQLEAGSGLNVYSLKFYGIGEGNLPISVDDSNITDAEKNAVYAEQYKQTFEPMLPILYGVPAGINNDISEYIDEIKSINHEFGNIRNANRISFIKNYYTLTIDLLFKQTLTAAQIQDIKNAVYYNLLIGLDGHSIDFGDRVTYNKVQQLIYASDDRILGASIRGIDDSDFKSYALFWTAYTNVPFYVDSNPTNPPIGAMWVRRTGVNTYTAYEQEDGSIAQTVVSDLYDNLPDAPDSAAYFGVKNDNATWYDNWHTLTNGTSYWICIQEPTQIPGPGDPTSVIRVNVTQYSGTASAVRAYPTTPQQLAYSSSAGGFIFKAGGIDYIATPIATPGGHYASWTYGQEYQFYFNPAEGINTNGQFNEICVSSEINELGQFDSNNEIGQNTIKGALQTDIFAKAILNGATPLYNFDNSVALTLQNKNIKASQRVNYVEPRLEIQLASEYTLAQNEYVQIFIPEFTTEAEYAFYVYAGYYNTIDKNVLSIPKDTNYTLKQGEYIIFYSRSDDESAYSYHVYGAGFIVSPSKTANIYNLTFQNALCNSTKLYWEAHGVCPPAINAQVVAATTAVYAKDRLTAFKSQDSCSIKDINQHVIQAGNESTLKAYSFITNSQDNSGQYVINFTNGYYIIEETESFSVYDNNSDLVIVLGAGTVLSSNMASLTSDGVNPKTIALGNQIKYTLCEIKQLEEGTAIRPISSIQISNTAAPSSITASTYNSALSAKKFEVDAYLLSTSVDGSNKNIANIGASVSNPYDSTQYSFADALQQYVEAILSTRLQDATLSAGNQTIYFKFNNYAKSGGQWTTDGSPKYYSVVYTLNIVNTPTLNYLPQAYGDTIQLQYRTADDSDFITLAIGDFNGTFTPLIRTAYCVNLADTIQNIYTYKSVDGNTVKQSVYGYLDNKQTDTEAIIKIVANGNYDQIESLSADKDIYILGGKQKLSQTTALYASQLSDDDITSDYEIHYNSSEPSSLGKTVITINPSQVAIVAVPEQVYSEGWIAFATVTVPDQDGAKIKITDGDNNLIETLYGDTYDGVAVTSLIYTGTKIILANTSNSGQIKITNNGAVKITFTFDADIIRYSTRLDLAAINDDIIAKLKELDANQQYHITGNRTYPIYNPLSSSSFFDISHPYHNYVICQCNAINWR